MAGRGPASAAPFAAAAGRRALEHGAKALFLLAACVSIAAVVVICVFLFANGAPAIFKIGPGNFLLGTTWRPGNDL